MSVTFFGHYGLYHGIAPPRRRAALQCGRRRSLLISSRRSAAYSSIFRSASAIRPLRLGLGFGFGWDGGLSSALSMADSREGLKGAVETDQGKPLLMPRGGHQKLTWIKFRLGLGYRHDPNLRGRAGPMERYIHNENIRRYRKLIEEETDEHKRAVIRQLLSEEEAREIPASPKPEERP